MPSPTKSLPVQLASRLVLDSVSYSNPLPPWRDGVEVDFVRKDRAIAQKIRDYLEGQSPAVPFEVLVPKKNGVKKRWLVPSVTDQIVLQAAVCALAKPVANLVDAERVFSYRYVFAPNRLQLHESQISSWTQFQDETQRQLANRSRFMLQIDLEAAFQRIRRDEFIRFLAQASPGGVEVELVRRLLDAFTGAEDGLPLINDSVFFLGNAYLRVVDQIVRRHAPAFIRFVDDYRIFGDSRTALEDAFERISRELMAIGFTISMSKVKLGSGRDYFDAIAEAGYAKTEKEGRYISAAVLNDVVAPDQLVEMVARVIDSPDDLMNEGLGRLLLGAIRRMRLNAGIAMRKNYPKSPFDSFVEEIKERSSVVAKAADLLQHYAVEREEVWRAVWIAYVFADLLPKPTLKAVGSDAASPVVRLWARWAAAIGYFPGHGTLSIGDLGYLEEGMKYYG